MVNSAEGYLLVQLFSENPFFCFYIEIYLIKTPFQLSNSNFSTLKKEKKTNSELPNTKKHNRNQTEHITLAKKSISTDTAKIHFFQQSVICLCSPINLAHLKLHIWLLPNAPCKWQLRVSNLECEQMINCVSILFIFKWKVNSGL